MERQIRRPRSTSSGLIAGLFGCLFGLLGIFTIGLIFVPLAALCALAGLVRGVIGGSLTGTGTSLLAGVLAGIGVVSSPSIWLVLAAGIMTSGPTAPRTVPPAPPPQKLKIGLEKQASTMARDSSTSARLAGSTCYMSECFDQHVEGTQAESNGRIRVLVKTRMYEASQPDVTLEQPTFSTYWVSCRSSGGYIENEERVRLTQPNPQPSHATEPGDKLWEAVCGIH